MQYPLILAAAFATASIAAPAACPPASTQGKEDVAKEIGKLAEEACPPSQTVLLCYYLTSMWAVSTLAPPYTR